jgi:hypothetical protein
MHIGLRQKTDVKRFYLLLHQYISDIAIVGGGIFQDGVYGTSFIYRFLRFSGTVGVVLAPMVAAVGVIAAMATDRTIIVEKR